MGKLTFIICLTISVLLSGSGVTSAGLFGPSNYEECILDGMKGVKSDLAAKAVIGACARKFPSKNTKRSPTTEPTKQKEKKPPVELDANGFRVCRVMSVNGEFIFVDRETLSSLKNIKLWDIKTWKGETIIWVTPKDFEAVRPGDYAIITMQSACKYFYKYGENRNQR